MGNSKLHYFEHGKQARNDLKLIMLDMKVGKGIGYAMYFQTLEIMLELSEPYIQDVDLAGYGAMLGFDPALYRKFVDEAITLGLFQVDNELGIYSERFLRFVTEKRSISDKRSLAGGAGASKRWNAPETEPAPKPSKPKPEPCELSPEQEDQIKQLREYAGAIFAEYPKCKHAKSTLTDEEYTRLIDKWGYAKLVVMQKHYFVWKSKRSIKPTSTDYGTLNSAFKDWVSKEADLEMGVDTQESKPRF